MTEQKEQRNWGGLRPGSGRPPRHGSAMVQKSLRLPAAWIADLIEGFGTFQLGVETLVLRHREGKGTMNDWRIINDRAEQINWLRQVAAGICFGSGDGTPEEEVSFFITELNDHEELPAWFDNHDRCLLLENQLVLNAAGEIELCCATYNPLYAKKKYLEQQKSTIKS